MDVPVLKEYGELANNMAGLIPENILDEVLSRVNIVDLISSYIPLKRAGRNFKACCPFHHEKTPSFIVSPDKQIYNCFGCGESGNAFKFLMRYERMDFPEAVETLARKAGVIIPDNKANDSKTQGIITELYKVNEAATEFYSSMLVSPKGYKGREYLVNRGISPETIGSLKIGFALESWDSLIIHLRSRGFSLSLLEKAGLIIPKSGGGYYDRFRNRIIFPISDIKGRVLGFGARVMDSSLPKYINSPETQIYIKGRNLYGLNLAKESIKLVDSVCVVEGYLDFIMPYQKGLKNIVASQGTALTVEQARLLKRFTNNIIIIYDSDNAGELATLRSLDIFIEEDMNVKVVSLPKGYDPDSFVCKNGVEALNDKIKNALSLFDYKLLLLRSKYDAKDIASKAKISDSMLETINKFNNAVLRAEYIKKLSFELGVKEDALFEEAKKQGKLKLPVVKVREDTRKKPVNISPTERLLMSLMFEEKCLISRIKNNLDPRDFKDERVSRVVSIMFKLIDEGKEIKPQNLMNHLEDDLSFLISEAELLPEDITLEHKERMVDDCLKRLKVGRVKERREKLHEEIKIAQHSGDEKKLNALIGEFHALLKKNS